MKMYAKQHASFIVEIIRLLLSPPLKETKYTFRDLIFSSKIYFKLLKLFIEVLNLIVVERK